MHEGHIIASGEECLEKQKWPTWRNPSPADARTDKSDGATRRCFYSIRLHEME